MIDTSVKHALEQAINEFNTWASSKNHGGKYQYNELKGVFFNKLLANLKGSKYFPNYWSRKTYDPQFISKFIVKEGKIAELEFINNRVSDEQFEVTAELNKALKEINLATLIALENFARNVQNFQILK